MHVDLVADIVSKIDSEVPDSQDNERMRCFLFSGRTTPVAPSVSAGAGLGEAWC